MKACPFHYDIVFHLYQPFTTPFPQRVEVSQITSKFGPMARVRIITSLPASPDSSDAVEWHFAPDLESEITTLATLCQLKQQQREPIPNYTQGREDSMDDPMEDEECTNFSPSLSLEDDAQMKKGFLDRLAELLCYRKDPALITSTALVYCDEVATIVAARNSSSGGSTWSPRDIKMLEYLAEVLERISSNGLYLFCRLALAVDGINALCRRFRVSSTPSTTEHFSGILYSSNSVPR